MPERLPRPETGLSLFIAHIEKLRAAAAARGERGPTDVDLADFFGVAPGSFGGWKAGGRPSEAIWPLIEVWSRGEVPATAWHTRREREQWLKRQAQIAALSAETSESVSAQA